MSATEPRPAVSVIVPFAGRSDELEQLVERLRQIALGVGDELIVADNGSRPAPRRARIDNRREPRTSDTPGTPGTPATRTMPVSAAPGLRVLAARGLRSAGFARNRGAEIAAGEWLVFIDADTQPNGSLLDDYFDPSPGAGTGVLAGGILDVAQSSTRAARHSAARGQMSQVTTLRRAGAPYAQTANCAIRRSAFIAVGGFNQKIRSGEDADLCFRLAAAGWQIEERERARVAHPTRASVRALLTQLARHGSGAAWLDRRYPGEFPSPRARQLAARPAHAVARVGAALTRGDRDQAAFALLDLLGTSAFDLGRLLSNRAREE